MKKEHLIILFVVIFFNFKSFATVQIDDELKINGQTFPLQEYFLESYFKKFPNKRPISEVESSNLWRGYVAQFEVISGKLYLADLKIQIFDETTTAKSDTKFKSVFYEFANTTEPFLVNWVDALVIIPLGEPSEYKTGSGLIYEKYTLLEFKKGTVTFDKTFDHKKYNSFVGDKYYGFLKRKELLKLKKQLIK